MLQISNIFFLFPLSYFVAAKHRTAQNNIIQHKIMATQTTSTVTVKIIFFPNQKYVYSTLRTIVRVSAVS